MRPNVLSFLFFPAICSPTRGRPAGCECAGRCKDKMSLAAQMAERHEKRRVRSANEVRHGRLPTQRRSEAHLPHPGTVPIGSSVSRNATVPPSRRRQAKSGQRGNSQSAHRRESRGESWGAERPQTGWAAQPRSARAWSSRPSRASRTSPKGNRAC